MRIPFEQDRHKRHLCELLSALVKAFPEKLAFKGGTCAYLFYNLPRFSFDLDFDIIKPLTDSDYDNIKQIMSDHGVMKDFYVKAFVVLGLFDYGKGYPNIKIELNKRVWKNNTYKTEWFFGAPLFIADEPTLATNKLAALTGRRMAVARDLYDCWYFLKNNYPLNEALINERTGKDLAGYLKTAVNFIRKTYNTRNILQGLGQALDEKRKIWVKAHLIEDTVKEIEKRM
jgi:predicted nucleotidyltransferase component of viral defense system